jgi:hypothetical protein
MDYTGGTCEYFAVSKKGCKLDGERLSSTQVDSFGIGGSVPTLQEVLEAGPIGGNKIDAVLQKLIPEITQDS